MKLSIRHDTTYRYDDQVRGSIQYLRLTPHQCERQHVLSWQLDLPRPVRSQVDPFGNVLHVLTLDEPHEAIVIHARGEIEIDETVEAEHDGLSALPYLRHSRLTQPDEALAGFAAHQCPAGRDRSALTALMQAVGERVVHAPDSARGDLTAAEIWAEGRGTSQDQTHVFLGCARSLGVPARYVSGYLFGQGSGQLCSHAWAEAWLDGAWYSFDVTHRMARPERHLKLAVGLDYLDACPVRGTRRGGSCEVTHAQLEACVLQVQQQ
jgi:transglutaminase-like putative cysteine protease